MKKLTTFLLITLVLLLSTSACGVYIPSGRSIQGSGDMTEETRSVGYFNQLILSGIGEVYVEFGDEEKLVIEAEENLLRYIETEVHGEALEIGLRKNTVVVPTEEINFYLTVVDLEKVTVSGVGRVYLPDMEGDSLDLLVSGAGEIAIDALYADRLEIVVSGIGEINIDDGEVEYQDVVISGPGKYSARHLQSSRAAVKVSGIGSATVNVSETLDAVISGIGDINYYGSPEVDGTISGMGNLNAMDD